MLRRCLLGPRKLARSMMSREERLRLGRRKSKDDGQVTTVPPNLSRAFSMTGKRWCLYAFAYPARRVWAAGLAFVLHARHRL
jgi:hypothetical protein